MKYVAIINAENCQVMEMVKETDDSLSIMQYHISKGTRTHRSKVNSNVHDQFLLSGGHPFYAKPTYGFGKDVSGYTF